jgi:hypothetical protein
MKKPNLDESKLTSAGKRQVNHIVSYFEDHKVKNKNWTPEDVARAVVLQEKSDKNIWKKKR